MRASLVVPPLPAVKASVALAVPLVATATAAGMLGGSVALSGTVLGFLVGSGVALVGVDGRTRVAVAFLGAAGAASGPAMSGSPAGLVACVVALGLLQAPLSRSTARAGAMLPVLPVLVADLDLPQDPTRLTAWFLGGFGVLVITARLVGVTAPTQPVAPGPARRHAVAIAVCAGAASWLVLAGRPDTTGHGYWLVLSVATLLSAVPGETRQAAGRRFLGTVSGVALAATTVLLLPLPAILVFALVCAALHLGWALVRDEFRQAVFGTPLVVLLASSGVAGEQVTASLERILLVGGGALMAVGAAVLLHRFDEHAVPTDHRN